MNDVVPTEPFQVPYTVFSLIWRPALNTKPCCVRPPVEHLEPASERCFPTVAANKRSSKGSRKRCSPPTPTSLRATTSTTSTSHGWLTAPVSSSGSRLEGPGPVRMGPSAPLESELKRQRTLSRPNAKATVHGTCQGAIMDAWWQARQASDLVETLSFVATLLFPDDEEKHKMDVDASNMDQEWAERPDEVMDYCIRDAELPLDILQAIQAVRRKEAVAAVAKVPFETAANGSTSQLLTPLSFVWRTNSAPVLDRFGRGQRGANHRGYVHDVEAGLHPWIAVLDFKSMYPPS